MAERWMHGDHRTSDEIRRDIDRTRADMDLTILSLQEKLSSRGLLDQLRQVWRDESRRSRILQTLRVSPFAASVAAAGLAGAGASIAYLLAEGSSPELLRRKEERRMARQQRSGAAENIVEAAHELRWGLGGRFRRLAHGWSERLSARLHRAREPMHDGGSQAEQSKEEVSEGLHKARQGAQQASAAMAEGIRRASHVAHEAIEQVKGSPLATAAAGVAAGVLMGALLPSWRQARSGIAPKREGKESCFEKAEGLTTAAPASSAAQEKTPS
jgi:ElaB/YqjD/DUF883 family membrane-anchored ribosome-binding protein